MSDHFDGFSEPMDADMRAMGAEYDKQRAELKALRAEVSRLGGELKESNARAERLKGAMDAACNGVTAAANYLDERADLEALKVAVAAAYNGVNEALGTGYNVPMVLASGFTRQSPVPAKEEMEATLADLRNALALTKEERDKWFKRSIDRLARIKELEKRSPAPANEESERWEDLPDGALGELEPRS